jgi:hypothetical protein
MGPDGIEIEVERSEEEIRADKAYNVKEYFESKKSGTDFTPIEVKTTKRVPLVRETRRSFDRVESFIKDKDLYSDDVKEKLDYFKSFIDIFMR